MRATYRLLLSALLTIVACTSSPVVGERPAEPPLRPQVELVAFALQPFDDCDALLDYLREHALERVTPWGLEGVPWGHMQATGDGAATFATAEADTARAGVDYSITNVQELGVDEPDLVKTDGERILVVAQGRLHYVDVTGEEPTLRGSLALEEMGWSNSLFLDGDTALLMGMRDGAVHPLEERFASYWPGAPVTILAQVDLSDPDDLRITRTLEVDGSFLSARLTGGVARVVLSSYPTGLAFVQPDGSGLRAEREAEARNREIILDSTLDDWVPYYVHTDRVSGRVTEGTLLDCARTTHPEEFAGLSTLSILTVDLGAGLRPADSFGLIAEGSIVYASQDSLYVSTQAWVDWSRLAEGDLAEEAEGFTSLIHQFDISDPEGAGYRASGEVPGFLLSQWSMSEHDGHLRVATTDQPAWWGAERRSESMVTVLAEREGVLEQVGQVGGLGKGEQIYAVRFMGDTGYVVTFRQVDPLYVIDLSDPAAPKVTGELKIPGYSAYLHPIEEGLILGVGQDADENGVVKGAQVAVFDVSDPSNPRRLHKLTFTEAYSEAEWDHHAFLHWAPTGTTVLPLQRYSWDEQTGTESFFAGAVVLRADASGIEELGMLSHGENPEGECCWQPTIQRSLVVDGTLYTVSELGLLVSDLESLDRVGWVEWR